MTFTAAVADSFGNPVSSGVTWSVAPAGLGTFVRGQGGSVTFRAGRVVGTGTVTATAGSLRRPRPSRCGRPRCASPSVTYRRTTRGVEVTSRPSTQQAGRCRAHASHARRRARRRARRAARIVTGAAGKARLAVSRGSGCYTVYGRSASSRRASSGTAARRATASAAARRRRRAGRRATPSASPARSRGAGSRSCPRRSA